MKIIIAPDSFKGTLSATQVAEGIAARLGKALPEATLITLPISDGGEGLVDALATALSSRKLTCTVTGPLGDPVEATYLMSGELAVIEMAQAAGLPLLPKPDVMHATTYGVGEMIAAAAKAGAKRALLGLGGSATNDMGCGMAAALGCRFWDGTQYYVPTGGTLSAVKRIEYAPAPLDVTALCDVKNPLYGANGAAYVYGRQKGATDADLAVLDAGLAHVAALLTRDGKTDWDVAGAGAAGGLGAGVIAFAGGRLTKGIDAVLDAVGFDALTRDADWVITGEGRLDSQSFEGKVIDGIIRRSACKVVALVGQAQAGLDYATWGLQKVFTTAKHQKTADYRSQAPYTLAAAADELADWLSKWGD
jgi:glycerate kinase